jgi:hypothetical protein
MLSVHAGNKLHPRRLFAQFQPVCTISNKGLAVMQSLINNSDSTYLWPTADGPLTGLENWIYRNLPLSTIEG